MPRKSDATRDRIMRAARERFARQGFERTTIRAVAADAAIDPALVMRYFGSKEGLFAAASEIDLELPDLRAVPRGEIGRRLAINFVERWETGSSAGPLRVLLRTATSNEDARGRLREIFEQQLMRTFASAVPKAEVAVRASLVASQMLGLALCRYILELPPVVALPPAALADAIAPTLERYIFGEITGADAPPPPRSSRSTARGKSARR
jgi:AcrR family transcriptional regulator